MDRSKVICGFGSTMILEGLGHGKPGFFLDPKSHIQNATCRGGDQTTSTLYPGLWIFRGNQPHGGKHIKTIKTELKNE